jgi:hypothetical protein
MISAKIGAPHPARLREVFSANYRTAGSCLWGSLPTCGRDPGLGGIFAFNRTASVLASLLAFAQPAKGHCVFILHSSKRQIVMRPLTPERLADE